jgi:hypothetical protein
MLPYQNLLRCIGTEDELSSFWSKVLDRDYEGKILFSTTEFGVGILTMPPENNTISFDTVHDVVEGIEKLSKSYQNIRFECSVCEWDSGLLGAHIFHNGKKYSYMNSYDKIKYKIKVDCDDDTLQIGFLDWASKECETETKAAAKS